MPGNSEGKHKFLSILSGRVRRLVEINSQNTIASVSTFHSVSFDYNTVLC